MLKESKIVGMYMDFRLCAEVLYAIRHHGCQATDKGIGILDSL